MLTASFHLIPLAVIIFVSFINYECTGYFEYSSTPRKLMINYGARYSVAYNEGDTISLQQIDSIEVHAATLLTYPQKARFIKSGAMTMIRQNAGAFILLTTKGIFNFFTDHSRYDIESFTGDIPKENQRGWRERYQKEGLYGVSNYFSSLNPFYYAYLLISMIINLLLLFGLFRFAFRKEIPLYCRLTFLSFIFYVALLSGMTGTTRFRLPVFLLIVVVNMVALGQKKYFSQNKEQVV